MTNTPSNHDPANDGSEDLETGDDTDFTSELEDAPINDQPITDQTNELIYSNETTSDQRADGSNTVDDDPTSEVPDEPIAENLEADDTSNNEQTNSGLSDPKTAGADEPTTSFPGTSGPRYVQPLLRDRESMLGGIASGIGKRYGLDISLVRIAFVLAGLTGFGVIAYLAAWIIIPKSPAPLPVMPVDADQTRKVLGVALIGGAVLFGLSTLDALGGVLIPLGLLAAGIWLLTQRPNHAPTLATPTNQPTQPQHTPPNAYGAQPVQPISPARRKHRWILFVLGFFAVGALLTVIAIAGLVAFASDEGAYFEANDNGFEIEFDRVEVDGETQARRTIPSELDELPTDAFSFGSLTLDLTEIDVESISQPVVTSEFSIISGTLEVVVPEDLKVEIDAEVENGSIEIEGNDPRNVNGQEISEKVTVTDPDIELSLQAAKGDIVVRYE